MLIRKKKVTKKVKIYLKISYKGGFMGGEVILMV